ncbi:hypothetical protein DK842_22720 [Chromobacterium phragmitis]|uniref:Uncharacterized protein n=3 Tax=Chromobacterium phragmitis TaxID=2202141 RepID=A0ABV0IMI1_9NEIS|nr:hypothetical protein DK842_22720 [Chromobacterium phragmitis]
MSRFAILLPILAVAAPMTFGQVSGSQAESIMTGAIERAARDGLTRFHPSGAFNAFLAKNGANGLMGQIRSRPSKAVMVMAGLMYEAGCKQMAGDYFRYNYQNTPLDQAEDKATRAKFEKLAGAGSEWCVVLPDDGDASKRPCGKPPRQAKRQQAVWSRLAMQAEEARSKRNAFLSTIKFNRFDYVAAVTSPGLDLYDPALQRPDNAACGVMADRMSEALFAGLKHDKTDEAYYARHRAAIDAVRSVWRKMDELEK